jgi:hypothetical protein
MSLTLSEPPATEKDNRRVPRYSLSLPTKVEVKIDNKFSWNELTRMEDVSAFGAAFTLKRPVKRGRIILLNVPMPRQLRCYDYMEPQYRIFGLVRRCIQTCATPGSEKYAVGVAFIGKQPPLGFFEDPSKLFELRDRADGGLWQLVEAPAIPDEEDLPLHLRRHTRFSIPEPLVIELLDEKGHVSASEVTVTENISLGGAAVFTSFDVPAGSFLRVKSERAGATIISIVRGKRQGPDGIVRLHIEFIDHLYPLEGLA